MSDAYPTVLVFSSANGGTGQTSITAHVALGLARSGQSVLMVEPHRRPVSRHYLPASSAQKPAAVPVALGSLSERTQHVESNLWLTTLDPEDAAGLGGLAEWANRGSSRDFWMVLDLPQNVSVERDLKLTPDVEYHIIRSDPSSLIGLDGIARRDDLRVVLNQIDLRRSVSRDIDRVLSSVLADRVAARIHYDEALPEALAHQRSVFDSAPESLAAQALGDLVEDILREAEQPPVLTASRSGD